MEKDLRQSRQAGKVSFEWASIPLLLVLWQIASVAVQHRLFPSPIMVFAELYDLALHKTLLADIGKTLYRAAAAFVVAMIAGIVIGGILGRFRALDGLFGNWVLIGLNIPAIVVAITFYIWFGLTEVALILAVVVNKTPLVARDHARRGPRAGQRAGRARAGLPGGGSCSGCAGSSCRN